MKQEEALNRYEGMFILPERLKDEELDGVIDRVRSEIEKAGGAIDNVTRLGKRTFSRTMQKKNSGHYVVVHFRIDGAQIPALRERYRLSDDVFRVQFVSAVEAPAAAAASKEEEGSRDGVAQ